MGLPERIYMLHMKNLSQPKVFRYSLGGAIIGICIADIIWSKDLTTQSLSAIIGFGVVYLTLRN